jgi:hypothetical protein
MQQALFNAGPIKNVISRFTSFPRLSFFQNNKTKKPSIPIENFGSSAIFLQKTRRFLSPPLGRFSFIVSVATCYELLIYHFHILSQVAITCVKNHHLTGPEKEWCDRPERRR